MSDFIDPQTAINDENISRVVTLPRNRDTITGAGVFSVLTFYGPVFFFKIISSLCTWLFPRKKTKRWPDSNTHHACTQDKTESLIHINCFSMSAISSSSDTSYFGILLWGKKKRKHVLIDNHNACTLKTTSNLYHHCLLEYENCVEF